MARRKQKHFIPPQTLLGLLVTIGALWLVAKALHSAQSDSGSVIGLGVLIVIVAAVAFPIIRLIRRASVRQALLEKVRATTDQKLEPLLRRRAQLVRLDPYGKPQHDKWTKEIGYFIAQHIQPLLTAGEQASLARNHTEVFEIIGQRVADAQRRQPAFQTFSDEMTPAEFETFCAEELRRARHRRPPGLCPSRKKPQKPRLGLVSANRTRVGLGVTLMDRATRRGVCQFRHGPCHSPPNRDPILIIDLCKLVCAPAAFQLGMLAVALDHQIGHSPDAVFGDHTYIHSPGP